MTDNDGLFSYVAQRNATGLRDAATNALSFIMSLSGSPMGTLFDSLGDDSSALAIVTARP